MYATTHLEMGNVNAKKYWIGQSAAKRLINVNDMMKVQRLARDGVGSSDPKRGADMKKPIEERFLTKVVVCESGCHEWTGCVMPNGYGQVRHDGKTAYAHRVAWELAHKASPGQQFVLHKCDNRKCVNPDHLFVGTFDDNMADMVSKKRQAHGERNGHAKLTAEQVRKIRTEVGLQREIAARYGVTYSLVGMIRSGRIWKSV